MAVSEHTAANGKQTANRQAVRLQRAIENGYLDGAMNEHAVVNGEWPADGTFRCCMFNHAALDGQQAANQVAGWLCITSGSV